MERKLVLAQGNGLIPYPAGGRPTMTHIERARWELGLLHKG
nr:hypothetical protein Q903MT_gene3025 [Picea sitchensis]